MKYRKLRIALSAAFIVAAVMLVMLWVRSRGRWERICFSFSDLATYEFQSGNGQLSFVYTNWVPPAKLLRWAYYSDPRTDNPTAYNGGFLFTNRGDKTKT